MAPSGDRSGLGVAQRRRRRFRAPARCRSEGRRSKPSPRFTRGGVLPSAKKTMAANSVRCPRDRGESVKGGLPPPFHKKVMTNRNSPKRAEGAQGSFDCRREAPGGPRTGPQLQPELRPKAIPDHGPVRGPLRTWRGAASSARVSRSRAMPVWRPALQAVPALYAWWRTAEREKNNGSELRSLPA